MMMSEEDLYSDYLDESWTDNRCPPPPPWALFLSFSLSLHGLITLEARY
jgi:hypothetical protein